MTSAGGSSRPRTGAGRTTDPDGARSTTDPDPVDGATAGPRTNGRLRSPVPERSAITSVPGLRSVTAVGLATGATALGVLIDILRLGRLGGVFTVLYFAGCVLAVCWVRRRNLFGPMVAPPLLLAFSVPLVVQLAAAPRPGSGIAERTLAIGAPLVNAFPTMATTTAVVLVVGGLRIALQPTDPDVPGWFSRLRGWTGARVAGRTSASPGRS